ncbi:hypothetical protein JTE90_023781 [Oedothorax gibbosus]|uniref:Uncharacterized protein n=1 Tax=Oedothorax gibbosus TaxID=931172 RepID=A0AAV6UQZ3_9ARAC|nr:hypothetical protein JTE90_023781 [Oedothorax gibbosus]
MMPHSGSGVVEGHSEEAVRGKISFAFVVRLSTRLLWDGFEATAAACVKSSDACCRLDAYRGVGFFLFDCMFFGIAL